MSVAYREFIERKTQLDGDHGFAPDSLPGFLFPFQTELVEWALRKGRGAIFADCGLGKTPMQLVWADQVARHTGSPVLILTPLAVSYQTAKPGQFMHVVGHFSGADEGRAAMGIFWMSRNELSEAIPPAYTEFIGTQLLAHIKEAACAS